MKKEFKQYRAVPHNDPLGILPTNDVSNGNDPLGLLSTNEAPKKKDNFSLAPTEEQRQQFPNLYQKPLLSDASQNGGQYISPSELQSKSTVAPAHTNVPAPKKNPNNDLADYASKINSEYTSLLGDWKSDPNVVPAPQKTGSPLEDFSSPLAQPTPGMSAVQQKQLKDKQEEDKIRSGDVGTIVSFTNRVKSAITQVSPKDVTDTGIDLTTQDALYNDTQVQSEIDSQNKVIADVTRKAATAIDYTVGQEAWKIGNVLDDTQRQDLGVKIRKAKSDIGLGEDYEGGNYASDLLKMSVKSNYAIEDIESHLRNTPDPNNEAQMNEYTKWAKRKDDYYEGLKNTQMFKYKNESAIDNARMSYLSDRINELLDKPSVQQYLNADNVDARSNMRNADADVREFADAYNSMNDIFKGRNDVIKKYPQAAVGIERQMMTEAFAQDFMLKNAIDDAQNMSQHLSPKYLKRLFVGQSPDSDEEIKAISEATGFSEDEVRKQAGNISLPSYLGEVIRGAGTMFAGQIQWLNRKLLPQNKAEFENSKIDDALYKAPQALQLSTKNINPETVFRTMGNGAGQFAAFALEGYLGGEALGVIGKATTSGITALGEATGATEAIFSNAPKFGRLLNIGSEFLADSGATASTSLLKKVADAGERARELAATYASGYTSSYEQAYKEAQTYSSDPSKWSEYADATAFLNGISELVLPDVDIAKKMLAVTGVKQLLKDGAIDLSKRSLIGSFMGNLGKIIGQETLEEYIPLIGQTIEKNKIFNYQTSTSDFFKQLWDTTLQTAISTIPMALLGSHGSSNSHLTKSLMYEISQQPDKYNAMIDKMRDSGEMPADVANERKKLINTLVDIRNKLPLNDKNGKEFTDAAKVDLMADIFKQRWNEDQKKNTDKTVHAPYDENITAAQENISTIMDGNHVEPVEVSNMRDNLEAARTAAQNVVVDNAETPKATTTTNKGDIVDNVLNDIFEGDLTQIQNNGTPTSEEAGNQSQAATSGNTSNVNTSQSQQERSQETTVVGSGDNINRVETGGNQTQEKTLTLQDRLDQARSTIVQQEPTMQENLSAARRAEQRRQQREDERRQRNQIIDEQTQGEPNKQVNVAQTDNNSDTVSIVNEAPQTVASNEISPTQAERRNIPGVFRFGEVQNIPIESISNRDDAFRGRRKVAKETIRFFRKNNSNEPVMVYRADNGKIYVLDGRSRIEAKRANRRKTVAVRFFNGTAEEARQYAELTRPASATGELNKRAARVTMHDPQSFEEAVLQRLIGNKKKKKFGFSRADFARTMGFGAVSTNRNSMAYGKMIGFNDIKDSVKNGMLREKGISFNEFTQSWLTRNEGVDGGMRLGFGNQNDLMQELGEIILRHQTEESVISRLEELNGIQGAALQNTALPFNISEQEATYIAENDLSNSLNSILNNVLDIELTPEEQKAYENLIRDNANEDHTMDINTIYNELVSSSDPDLVSLRNKLSRYATTEETITKSFGDTGSEIVAQGQDEEDFFSKGVGETTTLTASQAKTVGTAIAKAFKGLQVIVDANQFVDAFKGAIAKFSKQLSEQAEYIAEQLNSAQVELKTAQDELNAKRRQLDRTIAQDNVDLFGNRQSESANLLFNERVDQSARKKALKPFEDRVAAAQQRVLQLQDKLAQIAKQAPQQQSLFSRIPFQRRLNDVVKSLQEIKDNLGGVYSEMIDSDPEAVVKFIAEQYHDQDSRAGVIRQFGETIANEAARLFPNSTEDRPLLSKDGDVYGMVYNGKVYLNPNVVRADTPLHEIGGHILSAWAKENQPELYKKIIDVARQAPEELINEVRKNYPELSDVQDAFWEEVFSTFLGLDGRNTSRANELANLQGISAMRQAIKNIWNDFVNFLIDKGILKPTATFNVDDFREMTLSDFSNLVGEKMFQGRRLSAPAYDLRTVPEYANLSDDVLLHDNWGNPIALLPAAQQQVANAKVAERNNDIKNNTFKNDVRFQRIGTSAQLTPLQQMAFATAMQMHGKYSNDEIFLATGWFQDMSDKNFRYELPNNNVRFLAQQKGSVIWYWLQNRDIFPVQVDKLYSELSTEERELLKNIARTQSVPLENLIDYPELYQAYPELRDLMVTFSNERDGSQGTYMPQLDEIKLSPTLSPFEMYTVLRHEIQHAIQAREGFEQGSNRDMGEVYYEKKLAHSKQLLASLKRSLGFVQRDTRDDPNRAAHINYLNDRIREYEEEIKELEEDKNSWVYFFYRNFAGEREANSIMDRARIPDELRVVTTPFLNSADTAITYGDNIAVKKIQGFEEYNSRGQMFEAMASSETLPFDRTGAIKYDRINQLWDEIGQSWNEYQSLGEATQTEPTIVTAIAASESTNQITPPTSSESSAAPQSNNRVQNNMRIYKSLLNLANEYQKSGVKNISDYFASSEFAKLFGVSQYEDLPEQIKSRIENVLNMTSQQRDIVQKQIDAALNDGGNVQKNLQNRLNAVRGTLNNAQQDKTNERPRMRVAYNEKTGQWGQAPVGNDEQDAREELDSMISDVPGNGDLGKFLSGATIETAYGEAPQNNQDYEVVKLQDALDHGRSILATAKRAFGLYYAEPMLDYISKLPNTVSPSIKSLLYVSLENSLVQDKIEQPGRSAEISKMQTIVYEQSQAFARSISLALNYNRLRNIAFNGYTTEQATNQMFTKKEAAERNVIEKAVQANGDEVNKEADSQQQNPPDAETIRANAEATERQKAQDATTPKPKRKKSGKGTWEKKSEEKSSLKDRIAQLKNDIRDINC